MDKQRIAIDPENGNQGDFWQTIDLVLAELRQAGSDLSPAERASQIQIDSTSSTAPIIRVISADPITDDLVFHFTIQLQSSPFIHHIFLLLETAFTADLEKYPPKGGRVMFPEQLGSRVLPWQVEMDNWAREISAIAWQLAAASGANGPEEDEENVPAADPSLDTPNLDATDLDFNHNDGDVMMIAA
ncbi:hypothetical protein BOTBODRAFT_174223 [Botryobasidium botryosum FD-172 SS1]|uniref:Uncharacterized protein n=1 Tax=Botryobasidium botryosum (strain FD-172 SS1) TaxID=930990 RepID=A0A067MHM1_BOTB1|nr:hypothetical protein BOTBODRAFT_174223 [Botryobasidium botryosum FD-172 SS1]